uniref:Uncharacterized protein n=1 Tax=Amphora coffeiformis TaxID=265554 RepID=A0A7S3LFC4_9STRA|mmetsp:Transcript_10214/g.20673  ORF Transcript_10214/g.20673 Transcript_10214/m.20673 type:complete len:197 (+) Transcript_10214:201-791(+)
MPSNNTPTTDVTGAAVPKERRGMANTLQFLIASMLFLQSVVKLVSRFASESTSIPVVLVQSRAHDVNSVLTGSLFCWILVKFFMRYRTFWVWLEGCNVLINLSRKRMSLLWNAIMASLSARRNNIDDTDESSRTVTTTSNQYSEAIGAKNVGSVSALCPSRNQDVGVPPHVEEAVAVQRMERAEPVSPSLRDSKKV